VKFLLTKGYERIHRSNLVGMGVVPLQFYPGEDAQSLGLDGPFEPALSAERCDTHPHRLEMTRRDAN